MIDHLFLSNRVFPLRRPAIPSLAQLSEQPYMKIDGLPDRISCASARNHDLGTKDPGDDPGLVNDVAPRIICVISLMLIRSFELPGGTRASWSTVSFTGHETS